MLTMRNAIIPYNPKLRKYARELRKKGTLAEVILWKYIKHKAIKGYEFHRQVPIDDYIVDFYCHELKLAIEIDGISHDNKLRYDRRRQKRLEELGVNVIRFSDEDVRNQTESVLEVLKNEIDKISGK
ncbi:MAG: endonuclease domain-containing protein [bacterium]